MSLSSHSSTTSREVLRQPLAWCCAGLFCLAVGGLLSADRAWANLLLLTCLVLGWGIGAAFYLAFCTVTGARWHQPLVAIAQRVVATLNVAAPAAGGVALAGLLFYPWARGEVGHAPPYWFKHAWLSPGFFAARTLLYVAIWLILARWWTRPQRLPGSGGAAATLVLLGLTTSLAAFDWIMSLEPAWFSTMFGVGQFAGSFLGALAALVLFVAWLRHSGRGAEDVGTAQLHDLGKLLFGFSCFWMYIWFSQYLLIWYTNIPEESVYYVRRTHGFWWPLMLLNVTLNWGIPFVALLPRPAKCSWRAMAIVAGIVLVGRWVDTYLLVLPGVAGDQPVLGWTEVGGGLLLVAALRWFARGGTDHAAGGVPAWTPPAVPAPCRTIQ